MKTLLIFLNLLSVSFVFGQTEMKMELSKLAVFNDSIVTKIDKSKFVHAQDYIINCKKLDDKANAIFKDYFTSINGRIYLHLLSYKEIENGTIVLTCLTEGNYTPKLMMYTFDSNLNFKSHLILESIIVDVGLYEHYFSSEYKNNAFYGSYVNKWEKFDGKEHHQMTDSTVTIYSINNGLINSMSPHTFLKEDN
tara:strand:+ start:8167 stop:8748 length:582 start_codon:yes stop_codon:yes gene_type:complete